MDKDICHSENQSSQFSLTDKEEDLSYLENSIEQDNTKSQENQQKTHGDLCKELEQKNA